MLLLCNSTGNSNISDDFHSTALTIATLFWSFISNLKGKIEKSIMSKIQESFALEEQNRRVSIIQVETLPAEDKDGIYDNKNKSNPQPSIAGSLPKIHFTLPSLSVWDEITKNLKEKETSLNKNKTIRRTKNCKNNKIKVFTQISNNQLITKRRKKTKLKKIFLRNRRSFAVSNMDEGILRRKQLYCRTGYHLQILPSGRIAGTSLDHNRHAVLEFISIGIGLISIRGVDSGKYLSMDNRGRLYGSDVITKESIFREKMLENWYNSYSAYRKRSGGLWKICYVALNRNGKVRPGCKSTLNEKLTHFLPRPVDPNKVPDLYKGMLY